MPSLGRNGYWRKETNMMQDILKDPLASWKIRVLHSQMNVPFNKCTSKHALKAALKI